MFIQIYSIYNLDSNVAVIVLAVLLAVVILALIAILLFVSKK
jgi:hypothetical protein